MIQSLATVVIPFGARLADRVNKKLDTYSDLTGAPYRSLQAALLPLDESATKAQPFVDARSFVHFMSVVVVPARGDEQDAHLVIELCADGHPREALHKVGAALRDPLNEIFAEMDHPARGGLELGTYLAERNRKVGAGWIHRTPGLVFSGTPDLSVKRITDEALLAQRIRELLEKETSGSALARLERVRKTIFAEVAYKWAFVSEPLAKIVGHAKPVGWVTLILRGLHDFAWPLLPLPVLMFIISRAYGHTLFDAGLHAGSIFGLEIGAVVLVLLAGYRILRRQEDEDVPLDVEPDEKEIAKIQKNEDRQGVMQNHLFGVSTMKPGWVRRVTLRIALWVIAESGAKRSKPGFIDQIGTIHFARWIRLPGTDRLVFLSNYDGSWQSYLEDFIARLREGLTSVWSNTHDFPKTRNLIAEGARDGARFKRWARRQQWPTRFWYSAYPHLTTTRIRTHARIRHGLASAASEHEAAEWLSLFGYAGRDSLETREIPTLAFGGLPRLSHAHCIIVTLPEGKPARDWLNAIAGSITFGDVSTQKSALVAGFSVSGLRKLGLDPTALDTFPVAFQQGLAPDGRARVLGDDAKDWTWKAEHTDAVLLLYNADPARLDGEVREASQVLAKYGCARLCELRTAEVTKDAEEPFGFRDGVSQPVMRGTLRESREPRDSHLLNAIQPGELVLGYRDNLGIVAPTPRAHGQDIGRNGTFLVVRQLEQNTQEFEKYLATAAGDLAKHPGAPSKDPAVLQGWIAAKMVGRWKNGTSLVRNPHEPGKAEPDNAFMFGREDPDGLRCPLGAHIRRSNPRDSFEPDSQTQVDISNRHRILRVGRAYERNGGAHPGLLFMCINADIERQFEFLQQSWIFGTNFHGLHDEVDPILGNCADKSMIVPTPNGPIHLRTLGSFVKALGGGYFFMPGKSAVRTLAAGTRVSWTSDLA
jgi:deferrochelatase/peroxidase EfeB